MAIWKSTHTRRPVKPRSRSERRFRFGIEEMEARVLLSNILQTVAIKAGGVDVRYDNGLIYFSPDGQNLGGGGITVLAYDGSAGPVNLVPAGSGVDVLFQSGSVYYSPNGQNLGGGGSTVSAYSGSQRVLQMVPAGNGAVDTLFSGGGVYYSPNGQNLGGGGSTVSAYSGSQRVLQMVPAGNGAVDTLFSGGGVYYSPNGQNLGGGGSTVSAYTGSQSVLQMVPAGNGAVDTLFSGGGVYYSPNGQNLGGGGSTVSAYSGSQRVLQMVPAGNGAVDTLFSGGGVYYSPNGQNLGGGGSTVSAYSGSQRVLQMVPAGNGAVDTLFSTGAVYFSPDGKYLGGGGNTIPAYSGSQAIVQMVGVSGGVDTLFSEGGVYFSPDGKYLGGGGNTSLSAIGFESMARASNGNVFLLGHNGSLWFSVTGQRNSWQEITAGGIERFSSGTAGQNYSTAISPSGRSVDCTYTLASGTLPPGMSLNSSGILSGTTTRAATFTFTVNVAVNGASLSANQLCSLTINPGPASTLVVTASGTAMVGSTLTVTVTAEDAYSNRCTGYNGYVMLTSSNTQSLGPAPIKLTNGTGTVSLTPTHSGTTMLTAAAGMIGSNHVVVTVNPSEYWWTIQCTVEYYGYDDDGDLESESLVTDNYIVEDPNLESASDYVTSLVASQYSNYDWYDIYVSNYSYEPAN